MLVRRIGESWHEPASSAFSNEKELQDLVKLSPSLLPGGEPLAIVDEVWIPGVGYVDLLGVSSGGDLTIVECKLKANPEIRREVVGQILAYAGGLWRMSYDDFAAAFEHRSGSALPTAVALATGEEVDDETLRAAVSRRLQDGEFRLIVAVDAITPELRLIIEYLNEHTIASVQVIAFELSYSKDGDVEFLVPTVYGQEAATRKTEKSGLGTKWTAGTFAEQIDARTDGEVRAVIDKLLKHGAEHGHHAYFGAGATPGTSYYYDLDGKPVSFWSLQLYEPMPKVAINLGSIAGRSPAAAIALLESLVSNAALAAALPPVDEAALTKYPTIPVDVLTDANVQTAFFAALDGFVSPAESHSVDPG